MFTKTLFRNIYLSIIFMICYINAFSQPGDPGGDPDVPITGIGYLIAAGVFLGIRKFLNYKKNQ